MRTISWIPREKFIATMEEMNTALDMAMANKTAKVLVITGKGVQGDGVLRRRVPDWLGAAHLSQIVAGISDQSIITQTANQCVITTAAAQRIVAVTTIQRDRS